MKEFSYVIEDIQEIFPAIYEVLSEQKTIQARRSFVAVYGRAASEKLMAKIRRAVQQRMPQACVVGAVAMQSIVDGRLTDDGVAVSFTLYESSDAAAWLYDFDAMDPKEAGRTFAEVLAAEDDVSAIEFISTDDRFGIGAFFDELAAIPEDVAVFGGIAENGTEAMPTIFAGDAACGHGVLAIAFSGPDLHVSVNSSFGWKPLGRVMTITRMKDPFTVQSIDNRPAVEIYQTYLGLAMDEDILTEMLTFPLFLHRNGIALARLPQTSERDGSLHFAGDFFEGERVQIAYGDPQEILDTADCLQVGMAAFHPQAMYFVSCVARSLLLATDTEKELVMSRYAPSAGFYAYSEFLRRGGEFMTANMTLVTIGMREGEKSDAPVKLPERISHVDARTNIMRHLVNFVQQVIGELEDANERYRRLARAAGRGARRLRCRGPHGRRRVPRHPLPHGRTRSALHRRPHPKAHRKPQPAAGRPQDDDEHRHSRPLARRHGARPLQTRRRSPLRREAVRQERCGDGTAEIMKQQSKQKARARMSEKRPGSF